ncbi:MAG: PAS domain-containing sensor histidine kinase [Gammaproteobacteria bacterium]|nr:PAS domain-containing sensor histidine kinase [Gammaproteobacteria bacterium]
MSKPVDGISPQAKLEQVFDAFNHVSATLTSHYQELQLKVETLTLQLSKAQDERLKELHAKEKLATRLQTLISALPGGVLVIDETGIITDCNVAAEKLLEPRLRGQYWQNIIQRHMTADESPTGEVKLRNGHLINLALKNLEGSAERLVLLSDITASRGLQSSLQHQERLAGLGRMVGELAHQLRTPLASAFLYVGNLQRENVGLHERKRVTGRIQQCLYTMEATINDLLLFVKGHQTDKQNINLLSLFEQLKATFLPIAERQHITLSIDNQAGNVNLEINSAAFLGALHNICNNAIEAGGAGTHIKIQTRHLGNLLELRISDNGPGIADQHRQHIFEPFFTTRANGTGLGLAIVKTVIELHEGSVNVASALEGGACFVITLPQIKSNKDFLSSYPAPTRRVPSKRLN